MRGACVLGRRALVLYTAAAAVVRRDAPARAVGAADLLYGRPALQPQSYRQQLADAIPLKTMRGVWSVRETFLDGAEPVSGTATFTGQLDNDGAGEVLWAGAAGQARGRWLLKPDGFGRDADGKGIIQTKAAWKLRRAGGGSALIYSGRVLVPSRTGRRPDAVILDGCIDELVDKRSGATRKVGDFEASLLQLLELDAGDGSGAVVEAAPPQTFVLEPAASTREAGVQGLLYR